MVWAEFVVVIGAIVIGARVGGAGLGTMAAIGLAILVFGFGLPPSSPPATVLAIVLCVVTAAATMQAAGGLDLLVMIAERALRAKPKYITFVAPAVAYLFTFCSGTGHVAYAILPVIAEVARKAGIRPERPMSISVIASQQAITASPLAAATAALLALLSKNDSIGLGQILLICIPSTFIGCMLGALSVYKKGVELRDDPIYRERLEKGLVEEPKEQARLEGRARRNAIGSVATFLSAAAIIVAFGLFADLRPTYTVTPAKESGFSPSIVTSAIANLSDPERLDETITRAQIKERLEEVRAEEAKPREAKVEMAVLIQIVMLGAAGIMMLAFGARPADAVKTPVAIAGVVAVVSIAGLGWMGNCFFDGNKAEIIGSLSEIIKAHPWVFAVGLFGLSVVLFSQASTVAALMPVGIALGLPAGTLIAMFPAVNGYFFLPTYGTIVAAIAFDQTGTTRIGRFVLVHSFMRPGLVATVSAVVIGLVLSKIVM
ncbi:MAG: anaerobic C4-dicarboxylate transporter [Phycisphaeraceae bacterium]|mgnify:CR=1 FL=1|nr:anaerobic C4-dicarboxylate transporter [Phycisphaerae bacterium]MBX3391856.1 anaerobic C4-dicarboxylate transporter [Phycisphaeraceae bacterium]